MSRSIVIVACLCAAAFGAWHGATPQIQQRKDQVGPNDDLAFLRGLATGVPTEGRRATHVVVLRSPSGCAGQNALLATPSLPGGGPIIAIVPEATVEANLLARPTSGHVRLMFDAQQQIVPPAVYFKAPVALVIGPTGKIVSAFNFDSNATIANLQEEFLAY